VSQVSSFTQEMADIICERIAKGESLRKICLDKDTPSHTTILKWLRDIDGFASQYARAREATLFYRGAESVLSRLVTTQH